MLKCYQVFSIFIQILIVRWESIFLTHCIYTLPASINLLLKLINPILAAYYFCSFFQADCKTFRYLTSKNYHFDRLKF